MTSSSEDATPVYTALNSARDRLNKWFLSREDCEIIDELFITPQRFLRHTVCRSHCCYGLRRRIKTVAYSVPFPYVRIFRTSEQVDYDGLESYEKKSFYAFLSGDKQNWVPLFWPHVRDGFFGWCESGWYFNRTAEEHFISFLEQVDSYLMNSYVGYWEHILPFSRGSRLDSDRELCTYEFYDKMERMSVLDVCEGIRAIADKYPHFIEEEFIAKKEVSRELQHS